MKIEIKQGVIYGDNKKFTDSDRIVTLENGDKIAKANGFNKVEAFVEKYEGKIFRLGKAFNISKEIKSK